MNALDRTIIALDNITSIDNINNFIYKTNKSFKTAKIGLELFCLYGPNIVKNINKQFDIDIFLDLKLHDIPNTISSSIKSLQGLPIKFLTLHLDGGSSMIKAAMKSSKEYLPNTKIIGVSILTSLEFNEDKFKRLVKIAKNENIDGIVCSVHELALLREDNNLIKICPGIRFNDQLNERTDQIRIATPEDAILNNADYLVIGRSLTTSKNLEKRIKELSNIATNR